MTLIGPRGLAPKSMYAARSGRPAAAASGSQTRADGVADQGGIDEDGRLQLAQLVERERLAQVRRGDELALHDGQLLVVLRVVDQDLEHEAVDLGLRQRVGALGLDRVLGRHDEERRRHRMRVVRDRHLPLLHHLEQGRLHLRGDLVREQEVAEDRAELRVERALVGAVDASRRGRRGRGRA